VTDIRQVAGATPCHTTQGVVVGECGGMRTPREEKQGRCRSMGQRKWPVTPLPEPGKGRMQAT